MIVSLVKEKKRVQKNCITYVDFESLNNSINESQMSNINQG